jgi:acetyl esterase/lipase
VNKSTTKIPIHGFLIPILLFKDMFSTLRHWFQPTIDAIFSRNLSWDYRWRLLLLQPLSILTYIIQSPFTLSRAHSVFWIPTREGRSVRAVVYLPAKGQEQADGQKRLRPLHLNIHGGAFLGGLPEQNAPFCRLLAQKSGAVVVSTSYRYAPANPFPAAIDDTDDVIDFLQANAERLWNANTKLMTVGGFSAGGNLTLAAATTKEGCSGNADTAIKAWVGFAAPVCIFFYFPNPF